MSSASSSGIDCYSPTTNYLVDQQVPVMMCSEYQQRQLEREMERMGSKTPSEKSTTEIGVLSTVAINALTSTPFVGFTTTSTTASTSKPVDVLERLAADGTVSSDADDFTTNDISATAELDEGLSSATVVEPSGVTEAASNEIATSSDRQQEMTVDPADLTVNDMAASGRMSEQQVPVPIETTSDDILPPADKDATIIPEGDLNADNDTLPIDATVAATNEDTTPVPGKDPAADTVATTSIHYDVIECSFSDLLNSLSADFGSDRRMVKPLPPPITPLQTPTREEPCSEESVLQLYPSPIPSLEESSSPARNKALTSPRSRSTQR